MKNSSRFELKMARNLTRSSRGTFGSCASSSTRRLNSSHDNSRLTNASGFMSASPVEGLAQENAVADPARADRERQIPTEDHDLLDDDGPGQDDIGALRVEAADLLALSLGKALQPLADGGDVGLVQPQSVPVLAFAGVGAEVNTGQRADGAAEPHHDLPAIRGGQSAHQLLPDLVAERPKLAPLRWIVVQKTARHPHGTEREARHGNDLAIPHPAELQAGATEIRDHPVPDG